MPFGGKVPWGCPREIIYFPTEKFYIAFKSEECSAVILQVKVKCNILKVKTRYGISNFYPISYFYFLNLSHLILTFKMLYHISLRVFMLFYKMSLLYFALRRQILKILPFVGISRTCMFCMAKSPRNYHFVFSFEVYKYSTWTKNQCKPIWMLWIGSIFFGRSIRLRF